MLEERLNPVLTQLRAEERDRKSNFEIVRSWFQRHEENLANDLADMTYVCELPNSERTLLTYPVMGNWYLGRLGEFSPQSDHQQKVFSLLRNLVLEHRFYNSHMGGEYDEREEFNKRWDELNSVMLSNPSDSSPLHELVQKINKEVMSAVSGGNLPNKDTHTTDLGHGLVAPSDNFEFLTWYFGTMMEDNLADPLDLTIMVVDDQHPEVWYQRMISVGFKHQDDQKGFFYDCESALGELEKARYDVILSDLELGEGKMGGIEFVEKAFEIQRAKGIKPRISVFSYNDELLEEAEKKLRGFYSNNLDDKKVFHQVNYNNKAGFTATQFRREVCNTLRTY